MPKTSLCSLLLSTALCAAPIAAAAQDGTRTHLVIATSNAPDILDGQVSTGGFPLSHELISQPLVRFDDEAGVFVPDLLESFSISDDGMTMTMVLPEGATYTNGATLDAEAMKAAMERYVSVSPYAFDYDGMTEIRVIDATTLEVDNEIGFNVMLPAFMTSFGAPWDTAAAEEAGDAFGANPVGSGPFRIAAPWSPGLDLELERNDGYMTSMPMVENQGPAHIETITVRFISDALTRANELEAGSVDIVSGLPASALRYMADDPQYVITSVPLPQMTALAFNTSRPPFDDVALRQALAHAVDRDQLALALEGAANPEWGFVTPAMIAYSPMAAEKAQEMYPSNPAKATAALAAAGWEDTNGDGIVDKDGEELSVELLIDSGSAVETGAAPVLQAQLRAVGVDAQISMVDLTTQSDLMGAGNFDMGFSGFSWADPDILTYRFTEGSSPSQYAPADLAAALDAARGIADPAERADAYLDIQVSILEDAPMVPLLSEVLLIGARSWVEGLLVVAPDRPILNDVMINE